MRKGKRKTYESHLKFLYFSKFETMRYNFSDTHSVVNKLIAEMRNQEIQEDRMRFRLNMERLGLIMGYEISKTFAYSEAEISTPLGLADMALPDERIVIAGILRAALPFQNGLLSCFDDADCAFISSYRKHHKGGQFEVSLEYVTCPDITDAQVIVADPMVATGSSIESGLDALLEYGDPKEIHLATVIGSQNGLDYIQRKYPNVHQWVGAIDDELTARSYIVPGLGDAGDLAYGPKLQE
jgi:uracil phosphoribosyltransferase